MKKVVLGLLVLVELGMAKENWYIISFAPGFEFKKQCKLANGLSPNNARAGGMHVEQKEDNSYFLGLTEDTVMLIAYDNKKQCLRQAKILKDAKEIL